MKFKAQLSILSAMAVMLVTSCSAPTEAPKPIDLDNVKVEIQKMEDAYAAGEKAKDAAAVVAYYSDDAVSYNRQHEPSVGKEAIKARLAERLAKDTSGTSSVYKIVDLFAEGNMVVEIGSWDDVKPSGEVIKKGHYMSVFQKRDGKYICVRDMNVTSQPEKAPM